MRAFVVPLLLVVATGCLGEEAPPTSTGGASTSVERTFDLTL